MFLFVLEIAAFAVGANAVAQGFNSLFGGLVVSAAVPVSVFVLAEFIFAVVATEQSFLAAHLHLLLVTQLPALAIGGGMLVGDSWDTLNWRAVPSLVGTAVAVVAVYWLWGYFQAIFLGHRVDDPYTLPAFYSQLGMEDGIRDARYAQDVIIHVLFATRIWIAGGVALVISAPLAYWRKERFGS